DDESIPVRLIPSEGSFSKTDQTKNDQQLWRIIESRSVNFITYVNLMNDILRCNPGQIAVGKNADGTIKYDYLCPQAAEKKSAINRLPFTSTQAYSLLKFATEKFVKATVDLNNEELYDTPDDFNSPYLDLIYSRIAEYKTTINDTCTEQGLINLKEFPVLIELIWSYWHEEGMLAQTMHAIAKRFQNIRNGIKDPLANLEIDPLRPLNNILWGYIQDAQHRLTVPRRTYEYKHHYGIELIGKAISNFDPADSRSKFIESFHNLLYRCSVYFKEADDLTRRADGFPLLNALKEVHLLLSEGAHNQFGDLPTTARIEMLMEQWILAQPEVREFLGGRLMVPYDEPWMDRVDTMKTLQGWSSTSVTYYHDLAKYGEQILLSIRYTNWTVQNDRDFAAAWADFWRDSIQRYIHCYNTATGVDLSVDTYEQSGASKSIMPAILLEKKYQRERMLKRG
ncbi:MAG TPA: hypothetical protein PL045_12080, partial [Chitinophagaceae bacterium]|nr:hypothetical protein [Chitinophagaceae bacterium]